MYEKEAGHAGIRRMARARAAAVARAARGCETVGCSRSAAAAAADAPLACATATHGETGWLLLLSEAAAAARGMAAVAAGCLHHRRRRLRQHSLRCRRGRRCRRAVARPDGARSRRHEGGGRLRRGAI
eukprot:scaffold93081_cov78-Phaeocystis_antarctica.AAC.4